MDNEVDTRFSCWDRCQRCPVPRAIVEHAAAESFRKDRIRIAEIEFRGDEGQPWSEFMVWYDCKSRSSSFRIRHFRQTPCDSCSKGTPPLTPETQVRVFHLPPNQVWNHRVELI